MTREVQKENSMVRQKQMLADHFSSLLRAKESGQKVVMTVNLILSHFTQLRNT